MSPISKVPRPSSYPLLGPKYLLLGTIYPQLRVQGGSWPKVENREDKQHRGTVPVTITVFMLQFSSSLLLAPTMRPAKFHPPAG